MLFDSFWLGTNASKMTWRSQYRMVGDGGFKYFLFSPRSLGRWSNLTNIFQMGWNHQLVGDMNLYKTLVDYLNWWRVEVGKFNNFIEAVAFMES